ncbi:hypothetical protein HYH03_006459 [Edaphochlamys debaryana]|uniref:von Hippel-Lindau disease tumour suppressor beta domain-containing protein n=1 Tax=Edaphochlamys debaryana TaxID=47281 RepID=A0A835Y7C2_9CHLO|nr:hypothetical protein HYH03_006459 [Edaphochlamys debaryana]|eukprot:KAG2495516.1 hypothetical protein HYH03_006459 [Edaphochlamys debaryana]
MAASAESVPPVEKPAWTFADGEKVASLNSRFKVNMVFTNKTPGPVEACWVDFNGKENSYGEIEPGSTMLLYTYLTHPWVFRAKDHDRQLFAEGRPVAFPSFINTHSDITEAPLLDWTLATHASDYRLREPEFALEVQTLLRCYHVQRHPSSRRSTASGCSAAKSRRSSAGGGSEESFTSQGGRSCCCGPHFWPRRASHENPPAPATSRVMSETGSMASAAGSISEALSHLGTQPEEHSGLAQLPYDVLLLIVKHLAPPLREVRTIHQDEVEVMPPDVEPSNGSVARLAARLLGPHAPPAPAVSPAAWLAAAAAALGEDPAAAAAAAGPLGAGAAAGAGGGAQILAAVWAQIHQAPGNQPRVDDAASVPSDEVEQVTTYAEAMALANAAMTRAQWMEQRQREQARRLLERIRQQDEADARRRAGQAQPANAEQQAPEGQAEGEQQHQEGQAEEGQEGDAAADGEEAEDEELMEDALEDQDFEALAGVDLNA